MTEINCPKTMVHNITPKSDPKKISLMMGGKPKTCASSIVDTINAVVKTIVKSKY